MLAARRSLRPPSSQILPLTIGRARRILRRMSTSVDPKKVDCRTLRLSTLDDVSRELDRLEQADAAGKLRCTGNWTAGQCFGHLATWIEFGYEGFPMKPPPWPIRFLVRRQLRKYLKQGMPRGIRIPGSKD